MWNRLEYYVGSVLLLLVAQLYVLRVQEKESYSPSYPDTVPTVHASRTRRQREIDLSQGAYTPVQEQSRTEGQGKETPLTDPH
jgi:hypothetical protein